MRDVTVERTPDAVAEHACRLIAEWSESAIAERGRFTIALCGGRTPLTLYRHLRSAPLRWDSIHVFWSDERCVPPHSPDSNYGAAQHSLLDPVQIPAANIHRIRGEIPPIDAADEAETDIRRALAPADRLDLCVLGLGQDGHTASLFPRHQALVEPRRWMLPVHVPAAPSWRVTATPILLNASRRVLFLVVGEEKRMAIHRLLQGEDLPAGRVTPADGTAAWIVDSAAAGTA